ncbi:MAG: DNA internalization-related competence protein ComEC/Rec2, partial [Bacteroidota bacterium]
WALVGTAGAVGLAVYLSRSQSRLVTLRPLGWALAVAAATIALGAARDADWRDRPADSVVHLAALAPLDDRQPTLLWGTVRDVPIRSEWSVRFALDADSAGRGDQRVTVSDAVQVSLHHDEGTLVYPALRPGDRVQLAGRLEPLPRPRNPAQMDYGAYLQRQGIQAVLRVEDETGVAFLAPSRQPVARVADASRRHVRRVLAQHIPTPETRGLLLALLLADRSAIGTDTMDAFRETGLMHLLAVSGLHVGLVGLTLYVLLKPVLGRIGVSRQQAERARAGATLALLALYVVVAGASVSTVRAFVMVSVLILGRVADRRVDTLNALGVAAFGILLHRPAALFEVGFQLSFGAVAAIVTLTPLLTTIVPDRIRQSATGTFLAGSVATSIAATLGTAPALLAHFGRLPLGGLLLNVPAIPLTGLTLGGGIGAVVLAPLPPLAAAMGGFADASGRLLLWITESGATAFGWAVYERPLDTPSAWIASALVLTALALWRRPAARRQLALASVAVVAVGLWSGFAKGESAPTFDAVFLDVGQGDATLLSMPNGRHVLIDAGIRSPYVDQGERVIVPHLDRFGIRRLDALILTHADADHIGGAQTVLEHVPVGRLVVNGASGESDLWANVLRTADSLRVPIDTVSAGDTLAVDPSVRVRVLGPSGPMGSTNDASIVLRMEHGRTRWLLTGDAEAAGEAAVVRRFGGALASDVVTVGHHGSQTSSTPALVEAAGRPSFAVVSVARRNRYGLPHEEPLGRWTATGADVRLTSEDGAVWLRSDGATVEPVDWRSGER